MAYDYRQAAQRLREKALLIAQRHDLAVSQRDEAREEVKRLMSIIDERDKEIARLRVEVENLTVVTTAFPSKKALADSRKYLTGLVREIDQCITDLTS